VTLTRHVSCGLFRSIIFTLISVAPSQNNFRLQSGIVWRHRQVVRVIAGEWIENGGLRPAVFFQRSAVATLGLK